MRATMWRTIGVLAGATGGTAAGYGLVKAFEGGLGLAAIAAGVLVAVTIALFLIARTRSDPASRAGQFMPGLLLGFNTAINVALLWAIAGPVPALAIGAIPLLAVVAPLAQTDAYQAPLGWVNWLLPMSWPVLGFGLLMLVLTGLGALIGLVVRSDLLEVHRFKVDLKTGTIGVLGGLGANLNADRRSPGYNAGVAFLRDVDGYVTTAPKLAALVEHEAGHTLNLAIWGWVVHVAGALDEVAFGGGNGAYTELFAESNVPDATDPTFPMWSRQGMPASPAAT